MSIELLIQNAGYPLVFLFIAAESAGLPLPGETAVLIAAGLAGAGKGLNVWLVFLVAAAGAIVGDTAGYWIGRRGGGSLLHWFAAKGWIKKDHFDKAEIFFARHGGKTVFFGRWVSYLRIATAIFAGVSRMNYPKFLIYNIAGGITWAAIVSFVGFKFGRHWTFIDNLIDEIGWGVLIAAAVIATTSYFVHKKIFRRKSKQT